MKRSRLLRRLSRSLRPLVQRRVNDAIDNAGIRLDDEDALDALGERIARELDDAIDLRGIPVVGEALEVLDGPVIEALVHAAIDESVERAHKALSAARARANTRPGV